MTTCVGCGRAFTSEQSFGLHLWQARRRGDRKCSTDAQLPAPYEKGQEDIRIVTALRELLKTGDVRITEYEQKPDGYDVCVIQEMEDGDRRYYGQGMTLRVALERCAKETKRDA